jgi:tRNA 2-thiocytidine biosynthesis protein TtcA
MKKILGPMRRAIQQFQMISDGDRVAVGLSGGKDSIALLAALARYQKFAPIHFELEAITIDAGLEGMDYTPLIEYCHQIHVPYTILKTSIAAVVFNIRKEQNPCSLCARMRRGALHNLCNDLHCNKLALGHHADDAIETFFLSLFYEGRLNTFQPVTYLNRKKITLIRPLVFVNEKDIIYDSDCRHLPIIGSTCPADGFTKREEVKEFVSKMRTEVPDFNRKILSAIQNPHLFSPWMTAAKNKGHSNQ